MSTSDQLMELGDNGGFMWLLIIIFVGLVCYYLIEIRKDRRGKVPAIETTTDDLRRYFENDDIDYEDGDRTKIDPNQKLSD